MSFPLWGRLSARFGMQTIFAASALVTATLPLLWTLSASPWWLAQIELLGGCAWAGFEYASLQLLIRDAPREADVEFFSLAGTLSGALQLAGSLLGSWLLVRSGSDYHQAFLASSCARGLALVIILPLLARLALQGPTRPIFTRILSVRQGAGAMLRLVGVGDREGKRAEGEGARPAAKKR